MLNEPGGHPVAQEKLSPQHVAQSPLRLNSPTQWFQNPLKRWSCCQASEANSCQQNGDKAVASNHPRAAGRMARARPTAQQGGKRWSAGRPCRRDSSIRVNSFHSTSGARVTRCTRHESEEAAQPARHSLQRECADAKNCVTHLTNAWRFSGVDESCDRCCQVTGLCRMMPATSACRWPGRSSE